MRDNVIQILKSLSKDGKDITDQDLIRWANSVPQRTGKTSQMTGFNDSSLSTGLFFLDVINGIKKGIVDYSLVTPGTDEEGAINNAKYAISIARKLGATIFLMPDDIRTVKSKMILTFVGALMAIDRQLQSS
jgi:plastin-1